MRLSVRPDVKFSHFSSLQEQYVLSHPNLIKANVNMYQKRGPGSSPKENSRKIVNIMTI